MEKTKFILLKAVIAIIRLPLALLISIIAMPAQMLSVMIALGVMTGCLLKASALFAGTFISALGGVGLVLLGLILLTIVLFQVLGDIDDRHELASIFLWTVPEWQKKYKESLRKKDSWESAKPKIY